MLHHPTHIPLHDQTALAVAVSAAHRRAGRLAHQVTDPARDRDDHAQDILLDLITRSSRFDAERGSWGAFVTVVTRNAALTILARSSRPVAPDCDVDDLMLEPHWNAERSLVTMIDARTLQRRLPASLRDVLVTLLEAASVTDAQAKSGQSPASFYRAVRQLRLRLVAAGLAPAGVIQNRDAVAVSQ
jgi:DNA-directed RNA polymerase specialized sigma24 family protein